MKNNNLNKTYNENFKLNAVKKLLADKKGLTYTASKLNIASSTLYGWKKKYANLNSMTHSNSNKKLSLEDKLNFIKKTQSLNENELGKFLRENGLNSSDLINFEKELLGQNPVGRPSLDPEIKTLRKDKINLERSLNRAEKALAEQSARIILLKKSHEIWGVKEDED